MTIEPTDRFKQFFAFLILETGLDTKQAWAQTLNVHKRTLELWLAGERLPPPEKLRAILESLMHFDIGAERQAEIRRRLADIELQPLSQIIALKSGKSRASLQGAHTLAEFLTIPLTKGLGRRMAGLTTAQRERVLYAASNERGKIDNEINAATNANIGSAS